MYQLLLQDIYQSPQPQDYFSRMSHPVHKVCIPKQSCIVQREILECWTKLNCTVTQTIVQLLITLYVSLIKKIIRTIDYKI